MLSSHSVGFGFRIVPANLSFIPVNMDFDDDAPPELVDITGGVVGEEEVSVKVPITIVTGMTVSCTALRTEI